MKNLSLTVKIWLVISLVSLLLYLVVLFFLPPFIRSIFTATLMERPVPREIYKKGEPGPPLHDIRIRGFSFTEDGTTIPPHARQWLSTPLFREIKQNAASQEAKRKLYDSSQGRRVGLRYVIIKDTAYGRPLYQIAFLRKSEEDKFVRTLLFRIMFYAGIALVISWFASLLLVHYLTRPVIKMQRHVKRIANRNWHEPLSVEQNDEIGQLARSIESMRQQLVKQDEAQQSILQNISHELKTPVMVIRSYARAMQDGVYPKGDLADSVQVIDEEGKRLEKLVKQLLYLTRLDYLATQNRQETVQLDKLTEKVMQHLYLQRPDIHLQLNLQPAAIKGDEEILQVMLENILENHLRHAVSQLEVSLEVNNETNEVSIRFWNDGPEIEPHIMDRIIKPFEKGREGKFGLGLAIALRIAKMHGGDISLVNERNGVTSTITLK